MKILVTGSGGFVGKRVVELAYKREWDVIGSCRRQSNKRQVEQKQHLECNYVFRNIDANEIWEDVLEGVDCVVHCAARVHQMNDSVQDALTKYREVNVAGTLNLARQALEAGVKRFVFLSSIKVNGEFTVAGQAFTSDECNQPVDAYGISKYEAEKELQNLCNSGSMQLVLIRPPLVYGPGVKANFLAMMRWVDKGIPLPLRSINNRRSLVYLDNLVDLILMSCSHPNAVGQVLLVSDDEDVSVSKILAVMAFSMEKSNRMLPCPMGMITFIARLLRKSDIALRVCGNLQLDISKTKDLLGWSPPISFDEGIARTCKSYLASKN